LPGATPANQQNNGQQRDTSTISEETINNEIGETTRTEVIEGGRVKRLSVAVLVDGVYVPGANGEMTYQARNSDELERIAALVRSSIGYDRNRGDQIEVINLRFAEGAAMVPGRQLTLNEQLLAVTKDDVLRMVELAIFGVLTLLVLMLVVRPLLRLMGMGGKPGLSNMFTASGGDGGGMQGQVLALPAPGSEGREISPANTNRSGIDMQAINAALQPGLVHQIGKAVETNPTESISIVRQWISQTR
jgi:flagellar M-ring protein FliF